MFSFQVSPYNPLMLQQHLKSLKSFRSVSSDIPHTEVLFHFSPALPFPPYFHLTSNCIRCPALSFYIFHPFTSLKERKTGHLMLLLYPQYQKSQRDGGRMKVLSKLDCAVSCLSCTAEELQRPSWRWKTHCAAVPAALFKSISVWVWEGGANGKKLNHRSKHS